MTNVYVIMANDSIHAVFSDIKVANQYIDDANEYDKSQHPHRLVFYRMYAEALDHAPKFFNQR
jgi:hypothetical protein